MHKVRFAGVLPQALALSFALAFTILFFSPADIFLGNGSDFVVGAEHVLLPMLLSALAFGAAGTFVLCVLHKLNKKIYKAAACLALGVLLSFYVQMLFFNGHMKSVTGDATHYGDPTTANTVNFAIDELLVLLPLVLLYAKKQYSNNKVLAWLNGRTVVFFSLAVFFMQLAGTLSMAAAHGVKTTNADLYSSYLSYAPAMSLSKDENIVVFLTDRLDGEWMDETLERYPELYDTFAGFTYYRNNVSCYNNTFPSVVQMLTGVEYGNEPQEQYIPMAWGGDDIPQRLRQNGWHVSLVIDALSTYGDYENIKDSCDNYINVKYDYTINYFGKGGVVPTMLDLSLGKLMPYLLKDVFIGGYASDFSNSFILADTPDKVPNSIGVGSDLAFDDFLTEHSLTADNTSPTFSFIHLNCSHDESPELTRLYDPSADTVDIYTTTRGGFTIIEKYFAQMKELGVYDNSTIIVLGDHGRPPWEITEGADKLDSAITTALLIKPANAGSKPLETDNKAQMSNFYFPASILDEAGLEYADIGASYRDIVDNSLDTDRFYAVYNWLGMQEIKHTVKYKINGDARNFNNWKTVE